MVIDEIRIRQHGLLIRKKSPNLFWDGGFELDQGDVTWWVTKPKVMETRTERPHQGQRFLHVETDRTYLVFPSIPVQAKQLYRFRVWVRGSGTVWPGLHKLAPSDWDTMSVHTAQRRRLGFSDESRGQADQRLAVGGDRHAL